MILHDDASTTLIEDPQTTLSWSWLDPVPGLASEPVGARGEDEDEDDFLDDDEDDDWDDEEDAEFEEEDEDFLTDEDEEDEDVFGLDDDEEDDDED